MNKGRGVLMILAAIGFAVWLGYRDGAHHRLHNANEVTAKR